ELNSNTGVACDDHPDAVQDLVQDPLWFLKGLNFLNRQRDIIDSKNLQILSNGMDSKLLKKIRAHRGLRLFWGLGVRGQPRSSREDGRCGKRG
ncbi:30S ribosomal protein S13p/S18e, partial [Lactarius deliciosus]